MVGRVDGIYTIFPDSVPVKAEKEQWKRDMGQMFMEGQ